MIRLVAVAIVVVAVAAAAAAAAAAVVLVRCQWLFHKTENSNALIRANPLCDATVSGRVMASSV